MQCQQTSLFTSLFAFCSGVSSACPGRIFLPPPYACEIFDGRGKRPQVVTLGLYLRYDNQQQQQQQQHLMACFSHSFYAQGSSAQCSHDPRFTADAEYAAAAVASARALHLMLRRSWALEGYTRSARSIQAALDQTTLKNPDHVNVD